MLMKTSINSYWLTRVVFLRCLAGLYAVGFLVSYFQNEYLLGDDGLTPIKIFVNSNKGLRSAYDLLWSHPTLFWFVSPTTDNLNCMSLCGVLLSLFVAVMGSANIPILFTLWALYFSIVNVGQTWYSFGWESQLLESGFLAMFMVPLFSLRRFPRLTPTSTVCIWGYRWLLFRIMIGAGMIKIRGDECWRDLTCMNYHYQTQPVPNPLSIYFHYNYDIFHTIETAGNHIVELLCPWLLLLPFRYAQLTGGTIQILFQAVLIASGNLSFLNWLTALPAVMCFDDASLSFLFSKSDIKAANMAEQNYQSELLRVASKSEHFTNIATVVNNSVDIIMSNKKTDDPIQPTTVQSISTTSSMNKVTSLTYTQYITNVVVMHTSYDCTWTSINILTRRLVGIFMTITLLYLSYPVVVNIMSPRQSMNISFEPFRIVNSYGAFGSITKVRHEVILQGTVSKTLTADTKWLDFEFACKPGDINRRPCVISPYHIRIDWLMWFAAFQNYQHCPWIVHLADKLLSGSPTADKLLAVNGNPFKTVMSNTTTASNDEKKGSKYKLQFVRAELYEYQYASLNATQSGLDRRAGWEVGKWWKRRHVGSYMPAVERNNPSVRQFLLANRLIVG